jgi:hypothetical protein
MKAAIPNKYPGWCARCNAMLDVQQGYAVLEGDKWVQQCKRCTTGWKDLRDAIERTAAERTQELIAALWSEWEQGSPVTQWACLWALAWVLGERSLGHTEPYTASEIQRYAEIGLPLSEENITYGHVRDGDGIHALWWRAVVKVQGIPQVAAGLLEGYEGENVFRLRLERRPATALGRLITSLGLLSRLYDAGEQYVHGDTDPRPAVAGDLKQLLFTMAS